MCCISFQRLPLKILIRQLSADREILMALLFLCGRSFHFRERNDEGREEHKGISLSLFLSHTHTYEFTHTRSTMNGPFLLFKTNHVMKEADADLSVAKWKVSPVLYYSDAALFQLCTYLVYIYRHRVFHCSPPWITQKSKVNVNRSCDMQTCLFNVRTYLYEKHKFLAPICITL